MRSEETGAAFWVERTARLLGFDRLAARALGDARYGPFVFVAVVLVLDVPVLSTVNYFRGYYGGMASMWWEWPGVSWWLAPTVVLLGVYALQSVRDRYRASVTAIATPGEARSTVDPALSRRLQLAILVVGLVVFAFWLSTTIEVFLAREGPVVGAVKWFVIVPLVYLPIGTDLAAAYLHVQLVLALRIREAEVPLDFSDPRRLGGLGPVGRTMRFAAVSVFVALTLYTLFNLVPLVVLPGALPTAARVTTAVFFGLAWTVAAIALAVGLYLLHRHMTRQRDEQLEAIHASIRDLGADDESLPYTTPGEDAEFRAYVREYVNLDRVERTRTVPLNVAVIWELVVTALLPVALQLLVNVG